MIIVIISYCCCSCLCCRLRALFLLISSPTFSATCSSAALTASASIELTFLFLAFPVLPHLILDNRHDASHLSKCFFAFSNCWLCQCSCKCLWSSSIARENEEQDWMSTTFFLSVSLLLFLFSSIFSFSPLSLSPSPFGLLSFPVCFPFSLCCRGPNKKEQRKATQKKRHEETGYRTEPFQRKGLDCS